MVGKLLENVEGRLDWAQVFKSCVCLFLTVALRPNFSSSLSALLQLILHCRLCVWVSFRGRVGCGVRLCSCDPLHPPSLLTTPPTRPPADPSYQVSRHLNQLHQHLHPPAEVYRHTIYSYVDVWGRNGKAKPPALGGRGDDTEAGLLPQCSHGGQVLSPLPQYHCPYILVTLNIVSHICAHWAKKSHLCHLPSSSEVLLCLALHQ